MIVFRDYGTAQNIKILHWMQTSERAITFFHGENRDPSSNRDGSIQQTNADKF